MQILFVAGSTWLLLDYIKEKMPWPSALEDDDKCILCLQEEETVRDLLLCCVLAREVWYRVLVRLGWQALSPGRSCFDLASWWLCARKKLPKSSETERLLTISWGQCLRSFRIWRIKRLFGEWLALGRSLPLLLRWVDLYVTIWFLCNIYLPFF